MKKNVPQGCYDVLVYAEARKPINEEVGLKLTVRQPGFATQVFQAEPVEKLVGSDVIKFEVKGIFVSDQAELRAASHPDARVQVVESPADPFEEVEVESDEVDPDVNFPVDFS